MLRGLIYSVVSAFCFGCLAILIKLAYQAGFGGQELLSYRFGFGAMFMFIYMILFKPGELRIKKATLVKAMLLGAFVYVAQSSCFVHALKYAPASTVVLIFYLYPAMVTVLSWLVFRFKITGLVTLSLALITFGCAFIFYDAFNKEIHELGLLFALGATIIFSVYLILCQKLLKGENPLTIGFYIMLFTAISFNLISPPDRILELTTNQFLVATGLGLIPTVFAITLLYKAIELIGSAYASIFSTIEPVATVAMAMLILGEAVMPIQLAGAVFIIVGIILPNIKMILTIKKRKPA